MLSDYRQDKWYTIFTEIILKTLQSATLAASVNDFISTSIESLSPNIHLTKVERRKILENLWKVFNVSTQHVTNNQFVIYFNFIVECSTIATQSNCT